MLYSSLSAHQGFFYVIQITNLGFFEIK
jgi:hypothetical protein